MGRRASADGSRVSSRRVWHRSRRGTVLSVGRGAAFGPSRQFRFQPVGPGPGRLIAGRRQRLRRARSGWKRLGVDRDRIRWFRGLYSAPVLPRVLGGFFRRGAFRDERRVARDRARAGAPRLSQLVPAQLPIRLRDVPVRPMSEDYSSRTLTRPRADVSARSTFATEVREYLLRTPRQLPSKYLYDDLGSALFEAICRLPWYRITRAEAALLAARADDILRPMPRPVSLIELGCGSGEKLAILAKAAGGAA